MIQLIKNVRVFREGAWKMSDILLADKKIEAIADHLDIAFSGLTVKDGEGRYAVPGYIDQHVHVTGGGGEGSFITQVPPLKFSDPVKAGVTTVVGLLGTDGVTRSVANLVAKTKALREYGLTAYCLTGSYAYPAPTLTGSVESDIIFIEECIGVKIAISDHRSNNINREALIQLGSDARRAGLLSGKAGIVHLHTGSGAQALDLLFDIIKTTEIPVTTFRPTHLIRHVDAAIDWTKEGGYADFTCDAKMGPTRPHIIAQVLEKAAPGKVTMSTDGNGSMPIWNDKHEMIGIGAGKILALCTTVSQLVKDEGVPLEEAIKPVTENVARGLGIYPAKGVLAAGSDADITLLDEALMPDTVFAGGRLMMDHKIMTVKANFED